MLVNFKVIGGRTASLQTSEQTQISDLKRQLSLKLGITSVQITLIYKGTKLDNKRTVSSYNITDNVTINVMISKLPVFELKLREYFSSVSGDPDKCLNEFTKKYAEYLEGLNLNQIERVCENLA